MSIFYGDLCRDRAFSGGSGGAEVAVAEGCFVAERGGAFVFIGLWAERGRERRRGGEGTKRESKQDSRTQRNNYELTIDVSCFNFGVYFLLLEG